jgi:hypothetical protein
VTAQVSRIQESESRIGKGLAKSHPHKAPCDVSGSEMTRRTLGHGAPQCLTVAYFIPNSEFWLLTPELLCAHTGFENVELDPLDEVALVARAHELLFQEEFSESRNP